MYQKPQPLYTPRNRKHCPVCGKVSYSLAGIHPQCAMDQADAKRMQEAKPRSKSPKKATTTTGVQSWQKICPKCRALIHIRKKLCDCGHTFSGTGSR
jgi:RNA polymerase subunit RPABC4/transcription elongation factor Spt4